MFKKLILVTALASLAACQTSSPDVISRSDAQHMATVQDAVVLTIRDVTVDGSQSGGGAIAGAVVGGIAGSGVGGRREGQVASVLGAVVGGVIGNAVERGATKEAAQELLVQLKNGDRRAIVQAKGSEVIVPGDNVIIVTQGSKVRVTKAPVIKP